MPWRRAQTFLFLDKLHVSHFLGWHINEQTKNLTAIEHHQNTRLHRNPCFYPCLQFETPKHTIRNISDQICARLITSNLPNSTCSTLMDFHCLGNAFKSLSSAKRLPRACCFLFVGFFVTTCVFSEYLAKSKSEHKKI